MPEGYGGIVMIGAEVHEIYISRESRGKRCYDQDTESRLLVCMEIVWMIVKHKRRFVACPMKTDLTACTL